MATKVTPTANDINGWMVTTGAVIPAVRQTAACCVLGTKIYIIGGYDTTARDTNYAYDTTTDSWATKTAITAGVRANTNCDSYGTYIFHCGGYNNVGPVYYGTMLRYDSVANSWTTMTPLPGATTRLGASVITCGDYIYVMGGAIGGGATQGTNFRYNIVGDSWDTMTPFPGSAIRAYHTAGVWNNYIYVMGGSDGTVRGQVWRYNTTNDSWDTGLSSFPNSAGRISVNGPLPRIGSDFYYMGGNDGTYRGQVWKYNITSDTWMTVLPNYTTRANCMECACGNYVYWLGGHTGSAIQATNYIIVKG